MAKPTYAKIKPIKNTEVKTVIFNENEIEVKQYLSVNDKLKLISNVVNLSSEQENFSNPVKMDLYSTLEIIYAYTNISFTDKQKDDPVKLYDEMVSSGFAKVILDAIPAEEYNSLLDWIYATNDSIYKYRTSALGILDIIGSDYSDVEYDVEHLQQAIGDKENLSLLRDILTKIG